VVVALFDSRTRAEPTEISKLMFHNNLTLEVGEVAAPIAGAVPQFGCWRATDSPPRLVVERRLHLVVPEQRRPFRPPAADGLWHDLVTLYSIGA
jgi:hypothetical protein